MKPFVLLATRSEDLPADEEYALFLRYTGLDERDLVRVRLEAAPMPRLDLSALSGIFVGGGPFNASDPPERKTPVQHRVEAEFSALLDEVVARDFPFLGACYGVGTLGVHQGAPIDRTYAEPISVVPVTLTDAGASDPILAGLPPTFNAFVGHKEAIQLAARLGDPARVVADLPRADVPGGGERVRDAVPPRARRRRHHPAHPRLREPRLLRRRRARADARCGRGAPRCRYPSRMLRTFVERHARWRMPRHPLAARRPRAA